jgi:hypothetical protein
MRVTAEVSLSGAMVGEVGTGNVLAGKVLEEGVKDLKIAERHICLYITSTIFQLPIQYGNPAYAGKGYKKHTGSMYCKLSLCTSAPNSSFQCNQPYYKSRIREKSVIY